MSAMADVLPDDTDLTLTEQDRRELVQWTLACAERMLPLFLEHHPDDARPRAALDAAYAWLRGDMDIDDVRGWAFACHAAAREATHPAATAAARVCGQAAGVTHMAAHARQVPRHTAKAFPGDRDLRDAELAWQRELIPTRFEHYVYEGD